MDTGLALLQHHVWSCGGSEIICLLQRQKAVGEVGRIISLILTHSHSASEAASMGNMLYPSVGEQLQRLPQSKGIKNM